MKLLSHIRAWWNYVSRPKPGSALNPICFVHGADPSVDMVPFLDLELVKCGSCSGQLKITAKEISEYGNYSSYALECQACGGRYVAVPKTNYGEVQ